MIVCTYEDRPSSIVGLKLLALSLARHCRDLTVHVYLGGPETSFGYWAARQPNIGSVRRLETSPGGWDVKPQVLLDCLDRGFGDVCWVDTEVVVTSDWRLRAGELAVDTIVVAEENSDVPGHGSPARTRRLGLPVARIFPRTLCTCVVRVTDAHRKLLAAWRDATHRPDYRRNQERQFEDRDWALASDEDLLAGLLGSDQFASTPVHLLWSGRDIAHCFCRRGYRVRDRLRNFWLRLPPLVHAQGPKPWDLPGVLFAELSPYCAAAAGYAPLLDESAKWMRPRSLVARLLQFLTLGNPNLRDLPVVMYAVISEWWRIPPRRPPLSPEDRRTQFVTNAVMDSEESTKS